MDNSVIFTVDGSELIVINNLIDFYANEEHFLINDLSEEQFERIVVNIATNLFKKYKSSITEDEAN